MAAPLVFLFQGKEMSCPMSKVDRSRLYGYVDTEVLDERGGKCELATLAGDGRTLIPSGGTSYAHFSPDGTWRDKSALKAVDLEGRPIVPAISSFKQSIVLDRQVPVEEYLSHIIHAVYLFDEGAAFDPAVVAELKKGTIYGFPFSYRGGLVADAGFLLAGAEGGIWMAVGKPSKIQFIGMEQAASAAEEDAEVPAEEEEEVMDFGMM